jgi:hypothetical protein
LFDGLIEMELPNVSERDLLDHIDLPPTMTAPLGIVLPAQLHEPVLTVFHRLGVSVFSPAPPRRPGAAVVFLIDDDDYIVARDFEVDVPGFRRDAEWFRPSLGGCGLTLARTRMM